jgi:hypothetical protein
MSKEKRMGHLDQEVWRSAVLNKEDATTIRGGDTQQECYGEPDVGQTP